MDAKIILNLHTGELKKAVLSGMRQWDWLGEENWGRDWGPQQPILQLGSALYP